ncbi:succinylglutamate desuccinylase [Thalassomonas sp. M1454]|nr:succinylglutamate desuccinylase [Thalassomonas sp. M1454]
MQQQLLKTGDFLAITRQYPQQLPEAFSFTLTHPQSQLQTLVSVLDTGVISFEPIEQFTDSDVVLSSAIHGNETAPIEICQQLIQELILGKIELKQRVLFLFGNPESINIGERFVEENLNRLFSGAHSDGEGLFNNERKRALALENYVRDFFDQGAIISGDRQRFHYDLHTAIRGSKNDKFAVYPFLNGKAYSKQQLQFLLSCGINTILLSHSPTTTFSYFSANEFSAHAFTVELGKVEPFGQNDMTKFAKTKQSLTTLITTHNPCFGEFNGSEFNIFEIYKIINREHENFTFTFADDAQNFTDYPVEHVLAIDGSTEHKVTVPGEAIIFPNANVALGQRALLTVIPVKVSDLVFTDK